MTRTLIMVVSLGALLLGGCTGLPESGEKGYVSGDNVVRAIEPEDRDEPVTLQAEDLQGEPIDLADGYGKPQVINVWGAWCVECRKEQDLINGAAAELGDSVRFLGLNVRDNSAANALAYEREQELPFRSIAASQDPSPLLAFRGTLSLTTVPALVVLDEEGRIGGSILGGVPSQQTIVDLVDQVQNG